MPDKEEQKLSCTESLIKGIKTLLASTTEGPICVRISREAAEILLREQEPTKPEIEDGWIIPEQEDGERLYGHYVTRKCDKDDGPREKMEIVKWGIDRLIKEMGAWDIIPNYDTLQFIVHEGEQSKRYLDWYADEKGKQIEETDHVMTVGIKFRGRKRKSIFDLDPKFKKK